MDFPENSLWTLSMRVYARNGVAPACLSLQDDGGADVNILLFCCWAASVGAEPLTNDALAHAIAAVSNWQEHTIQPLRVIRRNLKQTQDDMPQPYVAALRRALQGLEIDAEHIEQLRLADLVTITTPSPHPANARVQHAWHNLHTYLQFLDITVNDKTTQQMLTIIIATFPAANVQAILTEVNSCN